MVDRYTPDQSLGIVRSGLLDVGYPDDLLVSNYSFSDLAASRPETRTIELAAFGQKPFSARSACFGATVLSNQTPEAIVEFQSLGAPQIFAISPQIGEVALWKIAAEGNPSITARLSLSNLREVLVRHKNELTPKQVLRSKAVGRWYEPPQLELFAFDPDLVPVLEGRLGKRLDNLLSKIITESKANYLSRYQEEFPFLEMARLVFRLVAAKLLIDREHPDAVNWIHLDASMLIKAVESFYFGRSARPTLLRDTEIQQSAWEKIRDSFSTVNSSVEVMAYVYENTLVSAQARKDEGVHATPIAIAEYLVKQLPFEDLNLRDCLVFEPFSGHAPFLVAALGRLRDLLPTTFGDEERHEFFRRSLAGMEADDFAREVGLRSLMLADYPNKDSWDIQPGDVYTSRKFQEYLKRANVILCNPPFEKFEDDYRNAHSVSRFRKGAEALLRCLQLPPQMLGFVLPRSFISGTDYDEVRHRVDETYDNIEVVSLPDNAFAHSNVEPILLIAHGIRSNSPKRWSTLVEKSDYPHFLRTYEPTWKIANPALASSNLWSTPLQRVWDVLSHLPKLSDIAEPHRGIEYNVDVRKNESLLFSTKPKRGFKKGLRNVPGSGLEPYIVNSRLYLNMDPLLIRRGSHWEWDKPKVIANAARIKGDRWMMAAAVDYGKLRCYQRFHCIWATGDTPLEVIAAILNGPVANAYLSTGRKWGDLEIGFVAQIPVPRLSESQTQRIALLVKDYGDRRRQWLDSGGPLFGDSGVDLEQECRDLAWQIDADILAAYGLPRAIERELLEYFKGYQRSGAIPFEMPSLIESIPAWLVNNSRKSGSQLLLDQHEKYQASAGLLRSWLNDESEDEREPWEEFQKALDADRSSSRKFYE